MCWGLQHFTAVLHNRKPGSHCLPGLKQQACPVLPPPLPCDTGRGHVISSLVKSKRAALLFDKRWWGVGVKGRNACVSGPHPSSLQASSAEVDLELQFPFSPKCMLYLTFIHCCRMSSVQQIYILNSLSRDISWFVTSIVQSATFKPCRWYLKSTTCPFHLVNCSN